MDMMRICLLLRVTGIPLGEIGRAEPAGVWLTTLRAVDTTHRDEPGAGAHRRPVTKRS
jgi:hypothetical protein